MDIPLKIYLSDNYKGGYISLVSTGKNDSFDSFSIKRLPASGNYEAANNKIEANGYLNLEKVERLEANARPSVADNNTKLNVNKNTNVKKPNLILYAVIGVAVIAGVSAVAVCFVYKRKNKRQKMK